MREDSKKAFLFMLTARKSTFHNYRKQLWDEYKGRKGDIYRYRGMDQELKEDFKNKLYEKHKSCRKVLEHTIHLAEKEEKNQKGR